MKKILIIAIAIILSVGVKAQSPEYVANTCGCPTYAYTGGTSADTLYASDTLIWSIRIKGADVQKMLFALYIDKVTGTVSDSVYFYGSFDGTTLNAAIDTIFNSNESDGYSYTTASRWTNFSYPYLVVWNWDKGGARTGVKSVRKLYWICRNE